MKIRETCFATLSWHLELFYWQQILCWLYGPWELCRVNVMERQIHRFCLQSNYQTYILQLLNYLYIFKAFVWNSEHSVFHASIHLQYKITNATYFFDYLFSLVLSFCIFLQSLYDYGAWILECHFYNYIEILLCLSITCELWGSEPNVWFCFILSSKSRNKQNGSKSSNHNSATWHDEPFEAVHKFPEGSATWLTAA